jgi:oligoribonuclease (3'-5' exoribonuclease)
MKVFNSVLAIDIETTGLYEDKPQLLEISLRYQDYGMNELKDNKSIHLYVKNDKLEWASEEVEEKNKLIAEKAQRIGLPLKEVIEQVNAFIKEVVAMNNGYDIIFAAKNANTLVLPVLKNLGFDMGGVSYRSLDIPTLYYMDFGYIPTFYQIAKKLKLTQGNTAQDVNLMCEAISKKVMAQLGL